LAGSEAATSLRNRTSLTIVDLVVVDLFQAERFEGGVHVLKVDIQ
jgi:hypothetical protein